MTVRIASWNINSVRIRGDIITKFVEQEEPDILCLQETKVQNNQFPTDFFFNLGFRDIHFEGQKSYNGVAIISKVPLKEKNSIKFGGNDDARHISARFGNNIELHNFYVPAGGDEPDPSINPKFKHKLRFLDEMNDFFITKRNANDNIVILGDMNIAPLEHDVWSHKQLRNVVSHTEIEIIKMEALRSSLGWIDSHRYFVPETEKLYSWWSYRNRDWRKSNRGRRLDHIWITPSMENKLKSSYILSDARDWEKPSDHSPIITVIE